MNNEWQQKLAGLEVPPPEGSWEVVRNRLDEAAVGRSFTRRLAELSATPPDHAWKGIDARLSESHPSVEKHLSELEVPPPAQGWDRIARELDRTSTHKGNTRRYRRLIAAAAMITVALALWLAYGRTGGDVPPIAPPLAEKFRIPIPEEEQLALALSGTNFTDDADADIRSGPDRSGHPVTGAAFAAVQTSPQTPDRTGTEEMPARSVKKQDRYIVWMTPEGQLVRLSKKLQNMVCCVSGEEEGSHCQEQLERWQQQLAGSAAAHPGNFLDILDMVRALEDN